MTLNVVTALTRIFKIYDQVAKKSVTKTNTEADHETRDYDAMINDEDLYSLQAVSYKQKSKPTSPTVS